MSHPIACTHKGSRHSFSRCFMSCYSLPDLGLGLGRGQRFIGSRACFFLSFCHVGKELQFSYSGRTYKIQPYGERGSWRWCGGGTDVTAMTAYLGYTEGIWVWAWSKCWPFHTEQITPELCSGWRRDKSRVSVGILSPLQAAVDWSRRPEPIISLWWEALSREDAEHPVTGAR